MIDDLLARKYALNMGLSVSGTVGVLLDAKERGFIDKVQPLLDALIANKMRISVHLYSQFLGIQLLRTDKKEEYLWMI